MIFFKCSNNNTCAFIHINAFMNAHMYISTFLVQSNSSDESYLNSRLNFNLEMAQKMNDFKFRKWTLFLRYPSVIKTTHWTSFLRLGLFYRRNVNQKLILKFKKLYLEIFFLRNSRVEKYSKLFDQFFVFGLNTRILLWSELEYYFLVHLR